MIFGLLVRLERFLGSAEDLEAGCAAAHLLIAVSCVRLRASKNAALSRAPVARCVWKIPASS